MGHMSVLSVEVIYIKKFICLIVAAAILLNGMPLVSSEASSKVTVGTFKRMIEKETGIKNITTGMSSGRKVRLKEAAVLLVKADEEMHGARIDGETVDFILKNRITGLDRVPQSYRKWIAKAYALGLIQGSAVSDYSDLRCFKTKVSYSLGLCKKLVARLTNESKRYKLTEDFRALRSDEGLPLLAEYYDYILDSYPNGYYDCMLNFMTNQAICGNADTSELLEKRNCELYFDRMIWDTAFSKLTYADRLKEINQSDSNDRLSMYTSFIYPNEYDRFAKDMKEKYGYMGLPADAEEKSNMTEAAKVFAQHALNIDYRKIAKDADWKKYMLSCGVSEEAIENYIVECIRDELIIECDFTAADSSAVYYDRTPFTFKNCAGVVRTYAHYRIVSDNGKGFEKGELVIQCGSGRQCLRNTVISEDGLTYEWKPCSEWQDGYFDVGTDAAGNVLAAVLDIVHYKGVYIAAFGYPGETQCYYPGTLTVDGIIAKRMRNMTKEQYLAKWGYLY